MKKNIFIFFLLFSAIFSVLQGQNVGEKDINLSFNDFPQEKVFVHFNTSFLVSGENLFFKIYCLNANSNKLSNLSKIAYVELINSDKSTIIKQKVLLKSGLGKGDVFINASIPSGNYKLVVYTQWLRNNGESAFFQSDITIINPFRANERLTVKAENPKDSINTESVLVNIKPLINPVKNEFIEVNSNKKTFGKRNKVLVSIKSLKSKYSYGNYSVSIKKVDDVNAPVKQNSKLFTSNNHPTSFPKSSIFFLPELRGEIISGTVYNTKEANTTMPNIKVSLSIPGENEVFKISTTNKSGVFYFNVDEIYQNQNALIQVIDSKKDEFKLEINNYELPNYNDFVFNDFKLKPELNDLILKKSILNQIENGYLSIKKDSILPIVFSSPSYKIEDKKYILNNYTKFKTLKETITEIVDAVYILQKDGEHTFHVKFYNSTAKSDLLPLVLVDGILIQNHNSIIDYNAQNIKSISVVRDKYVYGGLLFNGIISIETLKRDYNTTIKSDYFKRLELNKPEIEKKYFKQEYTGYEYNRIPDFRSQLLWYPDLTLNSEEKQISFYTSDNIGDYEISVEGFTDKGEPVTIKEYFQVKN
jgi:hypothetical protein